MIILILTFLLVVGSAFMSFRDQRKSKFEVGFKKNNRKALRMFFFSLIGGVLGLYSGKDSLDKAKKSDKIAKLKEKENNEISNKLIESQGRIIELQEQISDTTKKVLINTVTLSNKSDSGKLQIERFKNLSLNLFEKIEKANEIIDKKNEIIIAKSEEMNRFIKSYNSVPIVSARVYFKKYAVGTGDIRNEFDDTYLVDFHLKNFGDYDIRDVLVSRSINRGKVQIVKDECSIDLIRSDDSIKICNSIILGDGNFLNNEYLYALNIELKWKLKYIYSALIKFDKRNGGFVIHKVSYLFKGVYYTEIEKLKEDILFELSKKS